MLSTRWLRGTIAFLSTGSLAVACGPSYGEQPASNTPLDAGGLEGAPSDDGAVPFKSCERGPGPGLSDCGPARDESCCASAPVPGGTFDRSNDPTAPATVSAFRLDRFEATVGRFRAFVDAVVNGWRPAAGSGKHTHLNGGQGLAQTFGGGFEPGWDSAWNAQLGGTLAEWRRNLVETQQFSTWTDAAGAEDARPIVNVIWPEAYAFCIWEGGFLPSEAEWNFAAAGGDEQRAYPWSSPPSSTEIDCTRARYDGCGALGVVGSVPNGDSRWTHADLAGSVEEWALDFYEPYVHSRNDAANFREGSGRVLRGGAFNSPPADALTTHRQSFTPAGRCFNCGLRCARSP